MELAMIVVSVVGGVTAVMAVVGLIINRSAAQHERGGDR
jgi:nitrate reductase gamma subunit